MALLPDIFCSSSKDLLDAPDPIPEASLPTPNLHTENRGAPSTRGDIMDLMVNVRAFFRAGLAVVQEEVVAVTDRVKATVEDIATLSQRQSSSQMAMQVTLDALDDARWRNK
ncbi:Hypothetical predicted protein [Pelobates cultripes]|uniref:Uncharacterized protein n=1 Tax=Pelobates cultripes TaxID=61616 RepID=A0AAD1RYS9_PELCU|nr:Hypothetical predicted protein [Pelobates cultripes]